jgi:1-acyl-sn-glycerol-3-phosphate acyltransferase
MEMKHHSPAFFYMYRFLLRIILPLYLRFGYQFKKPVPSGPKIIVGNHPMVWDVFPGIVMFKNDIIHTLIEDQIWSFSVVGLVLSLTNQVKMIRGVKSVQSLRESLYWLKRGHSLVVAPEGERTSVRDTRQATRGIVWLAEKTRVPLIPVGIWISDEDLFTKDVRYHFKNRSYTVESFFPRFRGRYFLLVGEAIRIDRQTRERLSLKRRQEIADHVLNTVYDLRDEARRISEKRG